MKKIGILFGQEQSFPPAFVERVNQKTSGKEIVAEFVRIDKVIQGEPCSYDVVIDRISQDVPFYRAWLNNAALTGTAVVNNPFWWSADDKFLITRWQPRSGWQFRARCSSRHTSFPRTRTTNHFAISAIHSIGKRFSITSAGLRFLNRLSAAAGRTCIDCTIARNFSALTTTPDSL